MILREALTITSVLVILLGAISVQTLTCESPYYKTEERCCPPCPPGNRVETDCSGFRKTSCQPCIEGTYMDNPNGLKLCVPCSICDSGSGLKVKLSCTLTSDTVCEALEGFFCIHYNLDSCSAAEKHRSCEAGKYISKPGTWSSDTECSDCSSGTFSNGSLTSCQTHTQCETLNLQLIKAGTASTDAECGGKIGILTVLVVSIVLLSLLGIAFGVFFYFRAKIKSLKTGINKQRPAVKLSVAETLIGQEQCSEERPDSVNLPMNQLSPPTEGNTL